MRGPVTPILIGLAAVVLLLGFFDPGAAQAAGKTAVRDPSPCDPACEIERFLNLNIGLTDRPTTLDQMRRLGKLQSDTEKPAEGDATLHELVFPDLELRVY